MTEFTIRITEMADRESIVSLWHEVFGDDEGYVRGFLDLLSSCGYTAAAFCGEELCSMTTVIRDLSMETAPCSYLYAVATRERYRGHHLASRVLDFCVENEQKNGRLVFTAPAEAGLFAWYDRTIGAEHIVSCRREHADYLPDAALLSIEKIDAGTYFGLREQILSSHPHVIAGKDYLRLTDCLCSYYGGGLYRIGASIAAVYPEEDTLRCQELLTGPDKEEDVIQTLLHTFRIRSIDYRTIGTGNDYIAAVSPFPRSDWFGLILD